MPVPLYTRHRPQAHPVVKVPFTSRDEQVTYEPIYDGRSFCGYVVQPSCPQLNLTSHRDPAEHKNNLFIGEFIRSDPDCISSRRSLGQGYRKESAGLQRGLVAAEDAVINKQGHVETCHPPVQRPGSRLSMGLQIQTVYRPPLAEGWSGINTTDELKPRGEDRMRCRDNHYVHGSCEAVLDSNSCHTLEFPYVASSSDSTMEGSTPFADYIDRMVATEESVFQGCFTGAAHAADELNREKATQEVAVDLHTDHAYIKDYRAMAEPLSEWVSDYVWKICTTGLSLPQRFVGAKHDQCYERPVPMNLARTTYTLLCSTLLQPSAIMLSLWYIAQLPVYFDGQTSGMDLSASESEFRRELLGDGLSPLTTEERADAEGGASLRLILLGCMLANKWLDDHTFSNRTWQSISDVPIRSINRLELFALSVLKHDLSVKPVTWNQWLSHLHLHHLSRFPYPAPIQRPSSLDPITCVRKVIEALIDAHEPVCERTDSSDPPGPIFCSLSIAGGKKTNESLGVPDPVGFDFDEDGPLREEYAPRRPSRSGPAGGSQMTGRKELDIPDAKEVIYPLSTILPPPSEWSPQGDPPLDSGYMRRDVVPCASDCSPHECAYSDSSTHTFMWSSVYGPSQLGRKAVYSEHNLRAFNAGFALGPVCLPISHTRSTLVCATPPLHTLPGHSRSYSYPYSVGNEFYSTASCGLYEGYPSMDTHIYGDLGHYRPLWLRA